MTLNIEKIHRVLDVLDVMCGIPRKHVTVGSTSALVALGLRETADKLSIWVERNLFQDVCKNHNVTNHPMTDTVVSFTLTKFVGVEGVEVEVRERNDYFPSLDSESGIHVFDDLTLLIQKRYEHSTLKASSESRETINAVIADIHVLNARQAEKNKVRDAA